MLYLVVHVSVEVNKKLNVLVGAGITNALFHVLVVESRTNPCPIDLLVTIHQLLIRIGPKGTAQGLTYCPRGRQWQLWHSY